MNSPYRILLVEDDPGHSQLVKDYLMMDPLYHVECVDLVGLFWEAVHNSFYDLILMDFRLPDGNGLETLEKYIKGGGQTPVVIVTAQGDERIAAQAIQKGAIDYVVKRGDYILSLPSVINKSIQTNELRQSIRRSLEQIRYQAFILNNVRDAVVVWNTKGFITFWNSAAASLFECSAEDRIGEHVSKFYFPAFVPALEIPPEDFLEKEVERKIITPSGKHIWVSSKMTWLVGERENSEILGYMDVIRDITERKMMEEKIQGAQSRLIQIARLAAVGELSSGIAHRINNPLTTILGDSQVLLKCLSKNDPLRESVEAIHEAGWTAQKVVQSLIDFSGPVIQKAEPLSINTTLQQAVLLVGAQIQTTGINIDINLEAGLKDVVADFSRLVDLWVILMLQLRDIALEHQVESCIILNSKAVDQGVLIELRLPSVILSQSRLANIFEPNFTSPITGFGTGMELTICREIIFQHHGQISATVDENDTVFQIIFPTVDNETN